MNEWTNECKVWFHVNKYPTHTVFILWWIRVHKAWACGIYPSKAWPGPVTATRFGKDEIVRYWRWWFYPMQKFDFTVISILLVCLSSVCTCVLSPFYLLYSYMHLMVAVIVHSPFTKSYTYNLHFTLSTWSVRHAFLCEWVPHCQKKQKQTKKTFLFLLTRMLHLRHVAIPIHRGAVQFTSICEVKYSVYWCLLFHFVQKHNIVNEGKGEKLNN